MLETVTRPAVRADEVLELRELPAFEDSAAYQGLPEDRPLPLLRRGGRRGRAYRPAYMLGGAVFAAVVVAVAVSVATGSAQAFARYGLGFVWSGTWSPDAGQYATGILVVGTVLTTGVGILIAAPVGLGAAVALAELVPRKVAAVASALIELLAAVPSIVVGLWALLVLSPLFARDVEPFLRSLPVLGALFSGPAYGPSILLAAVVLAIMVLPTLVSLTRSALRSVAVEDREAAMALGETRWQVVRQVVLPAARPGIGAAVTLAIGRALGGAIAVAMVIGNSPSLPLSLMGPGATLGSAIVNEFAEAEPGLGTSSVIALAAVLLALTVAVNVAGQLLRRAGRSAGSPGHRPAAAPGATGSAPEPALVKSLGQGTVGEPAQAAPVQAQVTLKRRLLAGRLAQGLCVVALVAAAAPLVALVGYTVVRALPALSYGLLFHPVVPVGVAGGGISTAIVGTARIVGLSLAMATPVGLLAALLLYERTGRLSGALRFSADV